MKQYQTSVGGRWMASQRGAFINDTENTVELYLAEQENLKKLERQTNQEE